MAIIDRGSNKTEDIFVVDPDNGRKTAVLVSVFTNKAGDVDVHVSTMGDGAPITVLVNGDLATVREED